MQSLWKAVWQFIKKLKTELPYDSAIPLLGIDPKELKTELKTHICTPIIHNSQSTEATQVCTDR